MPIWKTTNYWETSHGDAAEKKNLYNEIGNAQLLHLLEETMKELNFDVSYYTGSWYGAEKSTMASSPSRWN